MQSDFNPVPKLVSLFASACGGSQTSEWINNEIVPCIKEKDARIISPDFIRTLIPLVIYRHAILDKQNRSLSIDLFNLILTNADNKTSIALVEVTVKSLDTLITKPTSAGKYPGLVPLSSILYALQVIVLCVSSLADTVPKKLFSVLCFYTGLALHHPESTRKSKGRHHTSRYVSVTSPAKGLFTKSFKILLAPKIVQWITSKSLEDDPIIVHGSLALLNCMIAKRLVPWNKSWDEIVLTSVALCNLPVPSSVMHALSNLYMHIDCNTVLNATEKGLLRSPEVILPFLCSYLPAITTHDPIDLQESLSTTIANQLISSNETNASRTLTLFPHLWHVSTHSSRALLTLKALSVITSANGWKPKLNVYNALRAPVQLTSADVDKMAHLVKAESNDTVAIAGFEILAPYAALDQEAMSRILTIAWSRLNEKIRSYVLGAFYDANAIVSPERLSNFTEVVALAHILKASAFDAKRNSKNISALLNVKFVNVDRYFVHCVSYLVKHHPNVLSSTQLDHILGLILTSAHATSMFTDLASHPNTYTALSRVLATIPSPTTPCALVLSNPVSRRQYLSLLNHMNSDSALLPLLLFAHHPAIPEDTWATLAFHAKVRVEQWIQAHKDSALDIVRKGLMSKADWKRHASLRAASTLVWIDQALLTPLIETALQLVDGSVSGDVGLDSSIRISNRPAGKKGTQSGFNRQPPEPEPEGSRITLALKLIQSVTAHNAGLDGVILSLVGMLQSIDVSHKELQPTWQAICRCLDPAISSVHDSMAWLLCTLPPLTTLNETNKQVIEMTESIDDQISSVLFQVAMKTVEDPIHPVTMAVLHQVLERVLFSAQCRTQTSDKTTLNRVLDHVAFLADIYAQNATLAISPMVPVLSMMRDTLQLMRTWRKQAQAKAHEALVTLCHANPMTSEDQLNLLLDECTNRAGLDHVILACMESLLYVKPLQKYEGGWPKHMHLLLHALSSHPIYSDIANQVIDKHHLSVDLDAASDMILFSETAALASCSAGFLSKLLERDLDASRNVASNLLAYISKQYKRATEIPTVKDEFGIPVKVDKDTVSPRLGLLECYASLAPYLANNPNTLKTWVPQLNDPSSEVSHGLLAALRVFVRSHANPEFVTILQSNANHKSDKVRESIVVLTGECACHFDSSDPKLGEIIDLLINALRTPSESVQTAVASCLAQLPVDAKMLAKRLLDILTNESKYSIQRGAAYGIASLIAANPHPSLFEELELIKLVQESLESKSISARQSGLLLMECCTLSLGRMFESWLIVITPTLLKLFGDTNTAVREATIDLARIMMKNISTYAVKLLMPTFMAGLQSDAWRIKKASVELLSSLAYCSADKLSATLPSLIPALIKAVGESHIQVSTSATDALNSFSSMITTPEVECMVPMLMDALIHGTSKTLPALQALCVTTFEHYLDATALSFIVPVIVQALTSRTTDLKFLAAQILGNLTRLTEQSILLPYVNRLMPPLLKVVSDAVPKTRSMGCRALGILIRSMGLAQFPSLVLDLFSILDSSTSSAVEKLGAAQGQAEVLAALGKDHLEKHMPRIIQGLYSGHREGHLLLLVYLPATFGATYIEFLPQTLPAVLAGLADESELVRDSALRAASVLIDLFTHKAIDLLLPELMNGMFDLSWRIRQSSVELLGNMLGQIMGQKSAIKKLDAIRKLGNSEDQDADSSSEIDESESDEEPVHFTHNQQVKQVMDALSVDKYYYTLAALYILRSDTNNQVRQTSANVWRMLVSNTPRQLKEILPVLLSIILKYLARAPTASAEDEASSDVVSEDEDNEEVAEDEITTLCRETLIDTIQKLGDPILVQILPLLKDSLETNPLSVCSALKSVMRAAGRQGTSDHKDEVTAIVAWALNQPSANLRKAGADVFDELIHQTGNLCIESVVFPMLDALPESLAGLQHVISIRGHVMPVMLPRLLDDESKSTVLTDLLSVGPLGHKTTIQVFVALLNQFSPSLQPAIRALLSHPLDEETVDEISEILDEYKESQPVGVAISISAVSPYASQYQRTSWLSWLIAEMSSDDNDYMLQIYLSMDALLKSSPKSELESSISTVTTGLSKQYTHLVNLSRTNQVSPSPSIEQGTKHGYVKLFETHPKGCGPILAIILHILMYGAHKEQALRALILVLKLTPAIHLRGFVTSMTGPLIRILSELNTSVVKGLILESIQLVLEYVPESIKPFVPQLTRTVMKQLVDEDTKVKTRAHCAIEALIRLHPRPESVAGEVDSLLKSHPDRTRTG